MKRELGIARCGLACCLCIIAIAGYTLVCILTGAIWKHKSS